MGSRLRCMHTVVLVSTHFFANLSRKVAEGLAKRVQSFVGFTGELRVKFLEASSALNIPLYD